MSTVRDLLAALEEVAPSYMAFSWDRIGLQVGSLDASVQRVAITLDCTLQAVRFAVENNCQALISHHPVIWDPLATVREDDPRQKVVMELIRKNVSFIAAHTNWDCAPGGINDVLAAKLGLQEPKPFGSSAKVERLKLVVYTPHSHTQAIIDAAAEAGAGRIGNYSRCAAFGKVTGTFQGNELSSPFLGQSETVEFTEEHRVEMVLDAPLKSRVDSSIRAAHPYEEPAIDYVPLAEPAYYPAGRIGVLNSPTTLEHWIRFVDQTLSARSWVWKGHDREIHKVAVVGGAADGEWQAALAAGADVFLTGEVKQNVGIEASESGLTVIASGHSATEELGIHEIGRRSPLAEKFTFIIG